MPKPTLIRTSAGVAATALLGLTVAWLCSLLPLTGAATSSSEQLLEPRTSVTRHHAPASDADEGEGLDVEIHGIRGTEGRILIMVFDRATAYRAYDYEQSVGYAEIRPRTSTVTHHFRQLRSGPYAVVAIHDANEDYELNMQGDVPSEGYAASGAKGPYHEPSFQEAASRARHRRLAMHYLR